MTVVGVATEQRHCDVAVIGGGPAGSTAAALLSLLAGAVYARSPIGPPLLAFEALFYILSLADPRVALRAWRRRRSRLRETANAGA
jgi:glycine/D-amino acid oxidase-like deaminating enzyme